MAHDGGEQVDPPAPGWSEQKDRGEDGVRREQDGGAELGDAPDDSQLGAEIAAESGQQRHERNLGDVAGCGALAS